MSQDPKQTRGYRNKNPGNIDWQPQNRWQGQVGIEQRPFNGGRARFAVFSEHRYGIRALAVLLITYFDRHRLDTVRKLIGRWAPGNENDTGSYVAAVANRIGVKPDDTINLHRWTALRPLVEAIITHENGGNPYAPAEIDEGVRLAGVLPEGAEAKAVQRRDPVVQTAQRTGATVGVLGTGGVIAAATQAAPALSALQGIDPMVGVVIVVAVAVAGLIGLVFWMRRSSKPVEA